MTQFLGRIIWSGRSVLRAPRPHVCLAMEKPQRILHLTFKPPCCTYCHHDCCHYSCLTYLYCFWIGNARNERPVFSESGDEDKENAMCEYQRTHIDWRCSGDFVAWELRKGGWGGLDGGAGRWMFSVGREFEKIWSQRVFRIIEDVWHDVCEASIVQVVYMFFAEMLAKRRVCWGAHFVGYLHPVANYNLKPHDTMGTSLLNRVVRGRLMFHRMRWIELYGRGSWPASKWIINCTIYISTKYNLLSACFKTWYNQLVLRDDAAWIANGVETLLWRCEMNDVCIYSWQGHTPCESWVRFAVAVSMAGLPPD